jgi:phage gp46-like protein
VVIVESEGRVNTVKTRFLDSRGDYVLGSDGRTTEDTTVATRATVRLMTHRGEYWADKNLGSRLFLLRSLEDARAGVLKFAREALQPLLDTGEILSIELGADGVYEDVDRGMFVCQLLLEVSEGTIVELSALPIGV